VLVVVPLDLGIAARNMAFAPSTKIVAQNITMAVLCWSIANRFGVGRCAVATLAIRTSAKFSHY